VTYEIHPRQAAGGGPPSSTDHFARRYIVGIAGAGYPAVPQAAPFVYVPEPGDGSGLEAALALAAVNPGDVYVTAGAIALGGAVVAPLVIPAGCHVYGAGVGATSITGFSGAVDQGIFRLAGFGSGLSDLSLVGGSPDNPAPLGSSAALVDLAAAGARLERVHAVTTINVAGSAMRGCVVVTANGGGDQEFCGMSDLSLELVAPASIGGVVAPLLVESADGQAIALIEWIVAVGGNYSAHVSAGTLVAGKFVAFQPRIAGVAALPGAGAFRADQGGIFRDPATAAPGWIGIDVPSTAGGWVLQSLSIVDLGNSYAYTGIRIGDQAGQIDIESVYVIASATGILLPNAPNTGAFGVNIRACFVNARNLGIGGKGPNTGACSVVGTVVFMEPPPLGASLGLNCRGDAWAFSGVRVQTNAPIGSALNAQCAAFPCNKSTVSGCVFGGLGTLPRVTIDGQDNTFSGNVIESLDPADGVPALGVLGRGATVTGNVILHPLGEITAPVIISGDFVACTGNRIRSNPNAPAAIQLSGNACTAIGNTCETTLPAPFVLDTGAGNLVLDGTGTPLNTGT
jgi:hypothetical protein